MVDLLNVIIDEYKFLHPKDEHSNQVENFIPVKEVVQHYHEKKGAHHDFFERRMSMRKRPTMRKKDQEHSNAHLVREDVTQDIYEQLHKLYIENILDVDSFAAEAHIRS